MNENVAGSGLIDVSALQLDELLSRLDDSAFRHALIRILYPGTGSPCNGFQANI